MHIIFIPFMGQSADAIRRASRQWIEEKWKFKYGEEYCSMVEYKASKDLDISFAMSPDDVIYIPGHGAVGSPTIRSGTQSLTYRIVCERLVDAGFARYSRAKVKFYSCYSGVGTTDAEPFAKRAADYMRDEKGRQRATYYGYLGRVSQRYVTLPGMDDQHKRLRMVINGILETMGKAGDWKEAM